MMMLSVYAQNTVSMRSCARSPECHVIRLEERARGPILHVPASYVVTPSSPVKLNEGSPSVGKGVLAMM